MQGPYADYLLDAKDICNNCYRQVKIERVDPVMSRSGLRHDLDVHYARKKRTTEVEYHDGEPEPAHSRGTFCECGVEGSHQRLWEPDDVSRDRFEQLLVAAVASAIRKGIGIRRKETLRYALEHFDNEGDVDKALATGLDAGLVADIGSEDTDAVA
jgi:hypothetical protein